MRSLPVALLLLATAALAGEAGTHASARLLEAPPEFLYPGACAAYREGGAGALLAEPVYYMEGRVLEVRRQTRHLEACPVVSGKSIERYSRAEFVRLALAYPCATPGGAGQEMQIGVVRLRVTQWDTPHARAAANAGRLYRGAWLDRELKPGIEIELEADLLGACAP